MSLPILFVSFVGLELVLLAMGAVLVSAYRSENRRSRLERKANTRRIRLLEERLKSPEQRYEDELARKRAEAQRQRDFYVYGIEEGT
jgi:hypothetical protein